MWSCSQVRWGQLCPNVGSTAPGSTHFWKIFSSKVFMILNTKSDKPGCVMKEKESLRNKFKPCLLFFSPVNTWSWPLTVRCGCRVISFKKLQKLVPTAPQFTVWLFNKHIIWSKLTQGTALMCMDWSVSYYYTLINHHWLSGWTCLVFISVSDAKVGICDSRTLR